MATVGSRGTRCDAIAMRGARRLHAAAGRHWVAVDRSRQERVAAGRSE
ncbi:hypothetical protein [Pyrodictium delaneyi]|nr:hypothetical protein [Pyrodictium delaneyi]